MVWLGHPTLGLTLALIPTLTLERGRGIRAAVGDTRVEEAEARLAVLLEHLDAELGVGQPELECKAAAQDVPARHHENVREDVGLVVALRLVVKGQ